MEKAVKDLKEWWSLNEMGVLSDVGAMSVEEVRDYVGNTCTAYSFLVLNTTGQEEALSRAFQQKKYRI